MILGGKDQTLRILGGRDQDCLISWIVIVCYVSFLSLCL